VAHASGLDLLGGAVSPLRSIIKNITQHSDIKVFICYTSTIGLLRDRETEPRIIPGVSTDTTAFDQIVTRLQGGGWRYIKAESLPGA